MYRQPDVSAVTTLMLRSSKDAPAWMKRRATHRFLASAAVLSGACFDELSMRDVGGGKKIRNALDLLHPCATFGGGRISR
jgi:hypothetical protein